jgi:ORF6N domain
LTETKRLKEAVRRNIERFPSDFMFELTREEYTALRSQIATLETGRGKYSKFVPFAFTEQGVAMLSSVLNSAKAIQVNISIMRAFVAVRKHLTDHKDLQLKIEALEASTDRNGGPQRFKDVYEALDFMINTQTERTLIGFKQNEK